MTSETVGFIGVGLMGAGMAANVLAKGYPLHVVAHQRRDTVDALVAQGASEAANIAEIARDCTVIVICAPGSPQVEGIVREMIPTMSAGTVVIDCSTSDPTSTTQLAAELGQVGCFMVDAPLGGTPTQANAGNLATMIGADDATFARIRPVIETWAEAIVHMGPTGAGHQMKLLNNMLAMGYAAMYSEALALSEKVGISTAQFDSVIRGSRMDCGFYQTFMGYAHEGNRETHKFTITNALKDMRYLEAMADAVSLANPVGNAIKNSFALAHAAGGDGPEDYVPHLVDYVAKRNGVER